MSPTFGTAFEDACRHLGPLLDKPLREVVFANGGSAEARLLDRTDFAQAALFAYEVALYRLLGSRGVHRGSTHRMKTE